MQPPYQSLGTMQVLLCSSAMRISGASDRWACGEKDPHQDNGITELRVNQGTGSITRTRLLQCESMQVSSRLALGLQDGK